jgi:hypothetical protein
LQSLRSAWAGVVPRPRRRRSASERQRLRAEQG